MGPFHFDLPADLTPPQRSAAGAGRLLNGYDHAPVPVRRTGTRDRLSLLRDETESSHLTVAWPAATGTRAVTTATLRPRAEPYAITVELARGAVNRVRQFVAELRQIGLAPSAQLTADIADLTRRFGRGVLGTGDDPADSPAAVLDAAGPVADRLAALLAEQRFAARTQTGGKLPTRFGARLSRPLSPAAADTYAATFNAVRIVPDWREIEPYEAGFNWSTLDPLIRWANDAGLTVSIGPIIDLSDGPFPDWIRGWEGDVPTLTAFLTDFVATVVARCRQQCRTWNLFSGFNHADAMGLGEDDRVRLAARLLDTAREVDPEGTWLIGLAQPWGDYLASDAHTYSPFVLVDTLVRSGFELGGIELELLSGGSERTSAPRDALDIVQLLESFDHLGLPLEVTVGRPLPDPAVLGVVETCLAGPTVQGVYWDTWDAADPAGRVPGGAIHGTDPATLDALRQLRTRWLR